MTFIGRTPWLQPDWRVYLPRLHALLEAPEQIGFGDNSDLKCQTSGDLDPSGHINVFNMSVRMSNISDIPNCTSWVNQNYKCMECFHTPLNLIHPTLVFFDAFLMLHGQPSRNRALTANRPGPGRITVSNGAPFGKCFSGPKIQDSPGLHCLFLGIKFGCPKCFFAFFVAKLLKRKHSGLVKPLTASHVEVQEGGSQKAAKLKTSGIPIHTIPKQPQYWLLIMKSFIYIHWYLSYNIYNVI